MSEPILHIYPLEMEHGDATIVGNVEGLRKLRGQIDGALQWLDEGYQRYLPADGEYYDLIIAVDDSGWQSESWQNRPSPYFAEREEG